MTGMKVCQMNFKNSFVESLPGLSLNQEVSRQAQQTPGVAYSFVTPEKVSHPSLISWSESAAQLLDLDVVKLDPVEFAQVFSGNHVCAGMKPYAARYGGHQFGHWAGQLGDGRAITLAEVVNSVGQSWEIQLKGAGRTPYSRGADGRAVLRSSLREYVCSEAMYHLGVPTTRALSCVSTGDSVVRDLFYDGNPAPEPGAITTRLAPSFIRFGHFQICAFHSELELMTQLVHYVIDQHFPQFKTLQGEYKYLQWYSHVVETTASLIVDWLRVGFVHGVMNTDNLSIHGLTIDYGPYGWLDVYDPDWTPNTTDAQHRRYRFAAQPAIALWNLAQLGEALGPLLGGFQAVEDILTDYQQSFRDQLLSMMGKKLGFQAKMDQRGIELIEGLDRVLRMTEIDTTIFYRQLAELHGLYSEQGEGAGKKDPKTFLEPLRAAFYAEAPSEPALKALVQWLQDYLSWSQTDGTSVEEKVQMMNQTNPFFIPRNYILQQCIDGVAKGDTAVLNKVMMAIKTPYEDSALTREFFKKRPEWARHKAGCSALSCSS